MNKERDELKERKKVVDEKLEDDVKKANVCMTNLRAAQKKEWDGERVPVTASVEKLAKKVRLLRPVCVFAVQSILHPCLSRSASGAELVKHPLWRPYRRTNEEL